MPLPPLPPHRVRVVGDRSDDRSAEFLRLRRALCVAVYGDGTTSEPFTYDLVDRTRLDAVVVVPHYERGGERWVVLRSCLRPPVALRPREAWPVPESGELGALWEVVAGLVEEDERSPEGLRRCAARELLEEAGYDLDPSDMQPLGPSTFPAPGMVGERHFFFHARVDPNTARTPTEDGSALERQATLAHVTLAEALRICREGRIEDAKTELALRRLTEI